MYIGELENFRLSDIALSGQCFRMKREEDGSFLIPSSDRCVRARQEGGVLFLSCTVSDFEDFWRGYFDLDTDYSVFCASVDPNDLFLTEAAKISSGIRILRQDMWETIVSFLISQQNNITRIRRSVEDICLRYGRESRADDGTPFNTFPAPESLVCLEEDALMSSGLGYRSRYVVRAARSVCEGELDIEGLKKLDYPEMKAALLKVFGIGNKVADCVCLFAGHKLEAFPVDTHIDQVLKREYGGNFDFDRYKGYEGVIQQYIFFRELVKQERKGKR